MRCEVAQVAQIGGREQGATGQTQQRRTCADQVDGEAGTVIGGGEGGHRGERHETAFRSYGQWKLDSPPQLVGVDRLYGADAIS